MFAGLLVGIIIAALFYIPMVLSAKKQVEREYAEKMERERMRDTRL